MDIDKCFVNYQHFFCAKANRNSRTYTTKPQSDQTSFLMQPLQNWLQTLKFGTTVNSAVSRRTRKQRAEVKNLSAVRFAMLNQREHLLTQMPWQNTECMLKIPHQPECRHLKHSTTNMSRPVILWRCWEDCAKLYLQHSSAVQMRSH